MGIETWFFGHPDSNLVVIPTELPRLPGVAKYSKNEPVGIPH
jgi:hypothetical protein